MQVDTDNAIQEFQNYYTRFIDFLPELTSSIAVFLVFYFLSRFTRKIALKRLTNEMDDPLLAKFISRFMSTTILILGFLLVLQILGLGGMAIGLLSTAGVGAFIIGFAFKDIGENFLAGIVMAFNRPFRLGDVVELNGNRGTVVNLTLRDTQIKTFEGKDVYIPNAMVVKNPVINFTIDGFLRQEFKIGLDYSENVTEAMQIILSCAEEIPGVLKDPKGPSIAISDLGASSLVLTVYFWFDTFDKSVSGITLKNKYIDLALQRLGDRNIYLPGDILELKTYKEKSLPVQSEQQV